VTHADAIANVLTLAAPQADRAVPSAAVRAATITHVARCSDCWQTLAALHARVADDATVENAAMAERFGCEPIRDRLWALVDLDPATIAREHAPVARHLGWCLACRTRLAELIEVEHEVAPYWIDVAARVRAVAGRVVVRLGRVAAGLLEVPDAFVPGPLLAPVPARGGGAEIPGLAQTSRFELGDSGVWLELGIESIDDARAALSIRLTDADAPPLVARLSEIRGGDDVRIGRYTLRGTEPVVVRGLWASAFVLELHDPRAARSYRVPLDISPGA
jgi:hypothetical protein